MDVLFTITEDGVSDKSALKLMDLKEYVKDRGLQKIIFTLRGRKLLQVNVTCPIMVKTFFPTNFLGKADHSRKYIW